MRCSLIVFAVLMKACWANVLRNNVKYYFHNKYLIGERQGTVYSVKIPTEEKDGYLLGTFILYDQNGKVHNNLDSISIGNLEFDKHEPDCDIEEGIEDKGNGGKNKSYEIQVNTSAEGGEDEDNPVENTSKQNRDKDKSRDRKKDREDQHNHRNNRHSKENRSKEEERDREDRNRNNRHSEENRSKENS